jgi:hypothetical protein
MSLALMDALKFGLSRNLRCGHLSARRDMSKRVSFVRIHAASAIRGKDKTNKSGFIHKEFIKT